VEAYLASEKVVGFEFQLFEEEYGNPVDESPIVALGEIIDLGDNRQRVTGRWIPDIAFRENTSYYWHSRTRTTDITGNWSPLKTFAVGSLPRVYRLEQNHPNPFNPDTKISFSIAEESKVRLEIINILGQRIRILVDETMPSGDYQAVWDGTDDRGEQAASGIYFYRLLSGSFTKTRKMALLR
jgi:hypothetical protein